MTNIIGPDVSFYQDRADTVSQIDFTKMRMGGASFVIIRAGQNTWIDPDLIYNMRESKGQLPRGTYWYYDSRVDPKAQARLYISSLAGDLGELPLFADFEDRNAGDFGGWRNWRIFLEELKVLAPGKEIALYTAPYYWKEHTTMLGISSADLAYFKQYALWIANYGVSAPTVPAPWTTWTFWQNTDNGDGTQFGVESLNVDLNYFNGDANVFGARFGLGVVVPPPPVANEVEYYKTRWYGSDVHMVEIDPKKYNIVVTDTNGHLETVSSAGQRLKAKIAINADGWLEVGAFPHKPYSLAVTNGFKYSLQYEFRPFINIDRLGVPSVRHSGYADLWNAASGTRYIVENSTKPVALFGTEVQYVEKHPRTACGITSSGMIVIVVVDGRSELSKGVTLSELADILINAGVVTGFDFDGGGSSSLWYDGAIKNVPSDGQERFVVNHLAFISKSEPIGDSTMSMAVTRGSNVALWTAKAGAKTGGVFPANTQFEYKSISGTWVEMLDGLWMNAGAKWQYISILTAPTPPPVVTPPPPAKAIANIIHVFTDGSVNVIPQ
jgi:GH25 family lysozyme M1 (1,4-beta-N-acetylmuramidase)